MLVEVVFFFFQAEDGIRDVAVTGVQTCALPISRLKWPNDVLLGERKLAGILCEGRWHGEALQWLAVGVGVNVCNAIPAPVAHRAVALGEWLPSVRRLDVLDRLVPALARLASGEPALSERSEERRVGEGCGSRWS